MLGFVLQPNLPNLFFKFNPSVLPHNQLVKLVNEKRLKLQKLGSGMLKTQLYLAL